MKQMVNFGVSVWIKRNPLIVYLQEIIRVYRQTSNKRIKFRMHLLKFSHDNNSQSNILKKETITRNQRNIELRSELLRKIELTYFVAMETDSVTQSHNVAKLITDLIYQISYDVYKSVKNYNRIHKYSLISVDFFGPIISSNWFAAALFLLI